MTCPKCKTHTANSSGMCWWCQRDLPPPDCDLRELAEKMIQGSVAITNKRNV